MLNMGTVIYIQGEMVYYGCLYFPTLVIVNVFFIFMSHEPYYLHTQL